MVSGEEVANEVQVQQIFKSKSSKKREPVKSRYQLLPPCKCKFKCYTKISETEGIEIHKRFWEIEKRDERISWMFGMITPEEKGSDTRRKKERLKERNYARKYKFHINNVDICLFSNFLTHIGIRIRHCHHKNVF